MLQSATRKTYLVRPGTPRHDPDLEVEITDRLNLRPSSVAFAPRDRGVAP